MSNTTSAQDLGQRIEQMIAEQLAAIRASAQEAVARAFTTTTSASTRGAEKPARRGRSSSGVKRPSDEIAALGERFYQALCEKPGEPMTVLAADVGASARELHRSVTLLRRAGRVRTVGSRHLTRYFPIRDS